MRNKEIPSPVPSGLTGKYYPHYLPEGYEISNTFVNEDKVEISYINKNRVKKSQ